MKPKLSNAALSHQRLPTAAAAAANNAANLTDGGIASESSDHLRPCFCWEDLPPEVEPL